MWLRHHLRSEVLDTSFAARMALQLEDATATVRSLIAIAKECVRHCTPRSTSSLSAHFATARVCLCAFCLSPLAVLTQPKSQAGALRGLGCGALSRVAARCCLALTVLVLCFISGYRANKTIVVLTRAGRMFGVDSITGDQRWAITVAAPGTSAKVRAFLWAWMRLVSRPAHAWHAPSRHSCS